ncbi:MAG: tetratricopeptide repeat protein [Rhodospirillales bacterium]
MQAKDRQGLAMSGADSAAAALYDEASFGFLCYHGDPIGTIKQALEARPDFAMGYLFMAQLNLSGMEPKGIARGRRMLDKAAALSLNPREAAHLAAGRAFAEGDFTGALAHLESLLLDWPRDILALQMAQLLDFYRGDSRSLRDRVARRLDAWSAADPNYHGVLGLHAFGLEECGAYREAEAQGQAAVGLQPLNAWAVHSVAHVYEMEARSEAGIAWLRGTQPGWTDQNFFQVHNWWHLSLCHLEREENAEALALYDGPILAAWNGVVLELTDAASLLWRLKLKEVEVGARWQAVAEAWLPFVETDVHAFNDIHAVMAYAALGWDRECEALLARMKASADAESGDNAAMQRLVGLPLATGLIAFARADYAACVAALEDLRGPAQHFGGSHAQRDIIDLTLLEAAKRGGDRRRLQALTAERAALRPDSGWVRRYLTSLAEPAA